MLAASERTLKAAIDTGDCITNAAKKLGISRTTLKRAEDRYGISFPRVLPGSNQDRGNADFREAVQDMKPLDAVEYLLTVIEELTGRPDEDWQIPGTKLTGSERRMLRLIVARAPRPVPRQALWEVLCGDRSEAEWPDPKIVDVMLSRMRRKFRPVGIELPLGVWGTGAWTVSAPAGFVWPWEASL